MPSIDMNEQIKMDHKFHLQPIEKVIEDRKRKVQEMSASLSDCSMRIITLVLELQVAMGAQRKTVDGLSSNRVEHQMESISVKKQDTYENKWKRNLQYLSAAVSVLSGVAGLSGCGMGSKNLIQASTAGKGIADGSSTFASTMDGSDQATHAALDHDSQHSRMQSEALLQSKSQGERQIDTLYSALIQHLKNQNELKTQLARMVN